VNWKATHHRLQSPGLPHCGSPKIAAKSSRKKLETVSVYHCRACDWRFTPARPASPQDSSRREILDVHHRLEPRRLPRRGEPPSNYGHDIDPSTIWRWLSAHPHLTTYRRLREKGSGLFSPPRLICLTKLYPCSQCGRQQPMRAVSNARFYRTCCKIAEVRFISLLP
jgi:hypothetical protein